MTPAEMQALAWLFIETALGTVFRSLVLAYVCGGAVWLLRSRTAELRFLIWKWMLLSLFALPLLMNVTPGLTKPSQVISRVESALLPSAPEGTVTTQYLAVGLPPVAQPFPWLLIIPALSLVATVILLVRLSYNLRQLHQIARRSEVIRGTWFRELAHEIWLDSGAFVKPRVVVSQDVTSPVTFDADDSWILLPPDWFLWSEAKLRAVLTHEMAHVQRGDSLTLLLASLATCLFWFHPLSWYLRNQLAVLAEEACDEVVVAGESTPEQYANFLIEFARDVQRSQGRRLAGAIAVVGQSALQHRIERLFFDMRASRKGRRALLSLALVLFLPALYVTAAARPDQGEAQEQNIWPSIGDLSAADVITLEADVQANPEDLKSRMELLAHFAVKADEEQYTAHLLWFIQHHPAVETLPMMQAMYGSNHGPSDASRKRIAAAWDRAVADHPDSAAVLRNAAAFEQQSTPERALDLLKQAKSLDPTHLNEYNSAAALIYASAELQLINAESRLNNIAMSSEAAAKLRNELAAAHDPALLAQTGEILVRLSHGPSGNAQFEHGLDLIQQAVDLEPGNPKWKEALDSARVEPERRESYQRLMKPENALPQGTVRIGAQVAEASLVSKVEPIYPPLALQAQLQGTVEFAVTVGSDGKVQNLTLVRGHPLLVNAAKDAVLQYVYHPASQDGKAIAFETEVLVHFQLRQ